MKKIKTASPYKALEATKKSQSGLKTKPSRAGAKAIGKEQHQAVARVGAELKKKNRFKTG